MNSNQESLNDKDLKPGKDLKVYIENRIELFTITIAEKIASTISASIQKTMGIIFLSLGGIFLWIALGLFLGEMLESQPLGFLLASLPLLLVGIILYNRTSKNLEGKLQTDIIKKINSKALTKGKNSNEDDKSTSRSEATERYKKAADKHNKSNPVTQESKN